MIGRLINLVVLCVFGSIFSYAADPEIPDRIEVKGGAVLIGQILSVGDEMLQMQTSYAGSLSVDLKEVRRVVLGISRDLALPAGIMASGEDSTAQTKPAAKPQPSGKAPRRPKSDYMRGWSLDAGFDLNGKSGNVERFDLRFTVEAELERESDRLNIYGRYAYGTNRGVRSSDEIIGGMRYSNYFFDDLGLFFRKEVEQDDFEGIQVRSTSAAGLIFEFQNNYRLRLEARTGLSYRFEDYVNDGTGDYPGMDIGLDVNWQFVRWARFKGSYSFLPSIRDLQDFIFEQDSGFNLPLDDRNFWKLRFGIASQYNSQPDLGREKVDTRYYARLIASWQ